MYSGCFGSCRRKIGFLAILTAVFLSIASSMIFVSGCTKSVEKEDTVIGEETASKKWQVLGPGGGGAMFLPTVNPENPQNVFLRCDMTGAYVTHDGGNSWRMFHLRTVVRDFEFDPLNPSTIYASNTGLYRSEDSGAS